MHRFKASKYKNSIPKPAKRENCFTDLSVDTPNSFSNHVACSAKYLAVNIGQASSGQLGIFGVNDCGRKGKEENLAAHSGPITDFVFSPFNHDLLISASEDSTVKIWNLPSSGSCVNIKPSKTFKGFGARPETIQHHPLSEIFAVSTGNQIQTWDLQKGCHVLDCSVDGDIIQSISWCMDGRQIACTTKSKFLHVVDPRASKVVSHAKAHDNHKDSRVLWLGGTGKVITTGFTSSRGRELKVFDDRNISTALQSLELGSSAGVPMPFYDQDTRLLFIGSKGDSTLTLLEVEESAISQVNKIMLPDQTKGMGMMNKLSVDVMSCEVARLMQLCSRQVVPITIEVPRKAHRDYPSDLFPDTDSDEVVLTNDEWFEGKDAQRKKCSLDPSNKRPLSSGSSDGNANGEQKATQNEIVSQSNTKVENKKEPVEKPTINNKGQDQEMVESPPLLKPFSGVRASKFRHWVATVQHPSSHITNIPKLSTSLPGSCDGFHVNDKFAAVPLAAAGGQIAILEVSQTGRVSSTPAAIQNTSSVTDFKWNPFNSYQLAVGLDDGVVKIWNISRSGPKGIESEPDNALIGHYTKVVCVQYHPLARDLLASASFDMKIIIWNVETGDQEIILKGHEEEVMHMSWSSDGKYLATVAKDSKIRIFDPRHSTEPTKIGPGPEGNRGARIAWVCNNTMLFVSGFSKQGSRIVSCYDVSKLEEGPLVVHELARAPSTLIPHVDQENNIVMLGGKGDNLLVSFELLSEEPYIAPLATFSSDQAYQGFCFLSKTVCDVKSVEFARAWRMGKASLEPVSFKVPRVKMEYFQDDLFPNTRRTDVATMSSDEWLNGSNTLPESFSLKPKDMKNLSDAPKEAPKQRKYESYNPETYKTDEEKKEELVTAMSNKLDLDKELEQDTMEGVDDDEWDDY